MKQFEIGKTYALRVSLFNGEGKKSIGIEGYTVVKRSKCYAIFTKTDCYGVSDGNTKRTKILIDQELGDYANVSFMANDYLYAVDEISPDTIGIYDEADCPIKPHDALAQPEIVKFEAGQTYYEISYNKRVNGNPFYLILGHTVIKRTAATVKISSEIFTNDAKGEKPRHHKVLDVSNAVETHIRKISITDGVEVIAPHGSYFANFSTISANDVAVPEVLKQDFPEIFNTETATTTHAPDDTPETLYLDCEECFSDFAGDNSAPSQDIPDDRVAVYIPEHGKPHFPLVPYSDEFLAPQTLPHSRRKPRKHIRFEVGKTYSAFHDGKSLHIRIIKRMKKNATQTSQNIHLNVWGYDALTGGQIPNDGKIWWASLSNSPKDTVETTCITGGFIFRADTPDTENTPPADTATVPAPVRHEQDIIPRSPTQEISHAPAQFLSAASPLIHILSWRRSLVWLFIIFRVFLMTKSSNLNHDEAQNFHTPLGVHQLHLIETRGLKDNALHQAAASNINATLHASDCDTLAKALAHLSGSAVKKIGRQLGLLAPKEKGSGGYLGGLLAERFFAHRTIQADNHSQRECTVPHTYTDCKRQIVIIFD